MKRRRKRTSSRDDSAKQVNSLSLGGWQDYQQWADHDFLPRRNYHGPLAEPDEEPAPIVLEDDDEDDDWETEELVGEMDQPISGNLSPDWLETRTTEARMGIPALPVPPRNVNNHWVPENAYLRLETLVSTARSTDAPWGDAALNWQHQAICALCTSPRSVAEVGVYINTPIGVTRLLISYAITLGFLVVHGTVSNGDTRPTIELLRRVHEGLRRLV